MTTADQTVSTWLSVDRAALVERLSAEPVVTKLNHGFSVDVGETLPIFCRDQGEVRRLLLKRDWLVADLKQRP